MINTPGFSDKISDFTQSGVETFQRCFPQNPGKFCTLINTSGSRIVVNINFLSGSDTLRDITYTEVSRSQFIVAEITTSSILGSTSSSESSMTVSQTITDNRAFLNSTEVTVNSGTDTFIITTEYIPALARGPILVYCNGETWMEPSVTETVTINGNVTTKQTDVAEGIVNSINDQVSVPAGDFATVMMTTLPVFVLYIKNGVI